jgi:hypothetical protein
MPLPGHFSVEIYNHAFERSERAALLRFPADIRHGQRLGYGLLLYAAGHKSASVTAGSNKGCVPGISLSVFQHQSLQRFAPASNFVQRAIPCQ